MPERWLFHVAGIASGRDVSATRPTRATGAGPHAFGLSRDDAEPFVNPVYWNYRNLLKHALLSLHVLGGKRVLEYCGKACDVCKTYIQMALTGLWADDELAAS